MLYLGDFYLGQTIFVPFDTYDANGASITLTGLAVTDIEIYKLPSTTQRSSDNGYTLLDTDGIDFDGITGIHGFSIDTTDNTDAGFWVTAKDYLIVVSSVTVDTRTVNFSYLASIENRSHLRPTVPTRTLDVTATGGAGVDWGNVENATTTVGLSGTTIKNTTDVNTLATAIKTKTDFLPSATAGTEDGLAIVDAEGQVSADITSVAGNSSAATALRQAAIGVSTNFGGGGIIAASVTGAVGSVTVVNDKTGYTLSAAGVDAIHDEIVDGTTTFRQSMRLANAANGGKVSGADTNTVAIRDLADSTDRITATVDASGNRTAVTLDLDD